MGLQVHELLFSPPHQDSTGASRVPYLLSCTCPDLSHVPHVARVHTCPAHVPTCPATARVRTFLLLFTCTCPDLSRTCSKSSAHVQTCPHLPHVARVYTCPAHVPTCPATARVRTCLPVHVQTCPGTARVLSRLHMSRPVPRPHVPVPVVLLKSRRRPVPLTCLDLSRMHACPDPNRTYPLSASCSGPHWHRARLGKTACASRHSSVCYVTVWEGIQATIALRTGQR